MTNLNLGKLLKTRWKIFVLALAIQFILVLSGVNPYSFWGKVIHEEVEVLPLSGQNNLFDEIKSKLTQKTNTFSLYEKRDLVPTVKASGNYISASAYIATDMDSGEIITSKNLDARLPIASLTKVMTAVVALDLAGPEDEFIVSTHASEIIPTKIGVVPGEKMKLKELLRALLLTSANDSAQVIKEGINAKYNDAVFIHAMNEKARVLGLENSHFTNPQGFDNPRHFSSVHDLTILSRYALSQYPEIAEITKDDYEFLTENPNHKQFDLYNWNGLLGVYPGAYGVKIGYTPDAGRTTIVTSKREGKRVLVVVLGAPNTLSRDLWAAELLDVGFGNYGVPSANVTEPQLRQKYATWKYFN